MRTDAPRSLLARLLGVFASAVFLVLAFVFSLVFFFVLLVLVVVAAGYFWWKLRKFKRMQQESIIESAGHHEIKDDVPAIEGESRRVD